MIRFDVPPLTTLLFIIKLPFAGSHINFFFFCFHLFFLAANDNKVTIALGEHLKTVTELMWE